MRAENSPASNPPIVPDPAPAKGGAGDAPSSRTQHERAGHANGGQQGSSREVRGGEESGTVPTEAPKSETVSGKPTSAETKPDSGGIAGPLAIALAAAAALTALWWLARRRYG